MRNTLQQTKSTTSFPTKWKEIQWQRIHKYVNKLQQRIYHAESLGNKRKTKQLQRLLMRSKAALLLSIRRITQKNKGKKTAGIDGITIQTDGQRMNLYREMCNHTLAYHKPKPSYRTYIKKKNGKLRPLSIPIIIDRIWQNLMKMALEPRWEYRFEPTSYGFRPERGCHDAIERIYKYLVFGKSFHYDRHPDHKRITETIPALNFIKRLIQHIPEKHFKMLRWRESILLSFGYDPLCCPKCGTSMLVLEVYYKKTALFDRCRKVMGYG